MDDVLWGLEPATEAKHRLYQRYLDAWWAKMLQPNRSGGRWPKVTYLDAFAGPGRYLDGEDGSPVFALHRLLTHSATERMQLSRDRVRLVFFEKDRARYEWLVTELRHQFGPLDDLPARVVVRHGAAGNLTLPVLTELQAWGYPVLAIFDSWGNVNVPLVPTIDRIGHNKASEVIVTFGPNWFSRRESEDPQQLDEIFGGPQFWQPSDPSLSADERWRHWLNTYRTALERAGFHYRLQFMVVPGTGQPLHLVYGTGHPSGLEAMKDAMWKVDTSDGMSFKDPRVSGAELPGQLTMWAGSDMVDPELLELVHQHLRCQPTTTLEEIGTWLLRETARWRAQDARPAIKQLQSDGHVTVEPRGRITRASTVRLH